MMAKASRLLAALVAALVAMTVVAAPPANADTTVVKKVGATIIYKNAASPVIPGNCGVLVILEWKDPEVKGFEPTGWTGHYFSGPADARVEKTISGSPPFHNKQEIAHTAFYATGGANWFQVGWSSRAGAPNPAYPLDCSDQLARAQGNYGTQAWVEVTGTVSESSTAKCLAARKSYGSALKKVNQLRRDIRQTKSEAGKAKLRKRLDRAVKKRAQAAARLGKACNG